MSRRSLNVDTTAGKSINAIPGNFTGKGDFVWERAARLQ
jgi:hypothetical protein